MLKFILLFTRCWAMPLLASFILTALTAGLTSRWSASAVGPVMIGLLAVELLLFVGGSVFLWRRLAGSRDSLPLVLTIGAHAVLQILTYAVLLILTLVAFNR